MKDMIQGGWQNPWGFASGTSRSEVFKENFIIVIEILNIIFIKIYIQDHVKLMVEFG